MRIVSLRAENVKRLKAVEITPEGDVVVISGRNAQGKSSVLDAIWMALAGGSGAKETTRAIRDGEEKASVQLDLGDMTVLRKWTKAGTTLEVRTAEGMKYPSPQAVLDGLIGRLSFDPLAFAQQDARHQVETLLSVVDLPFDPEELDQRRSAVFDARTDVNRETKRLEAQLEGVPSFPDDTPDEEVSAAGLAKELQAANDAVREVEQLGHAVNDAHEAFAHAKAGLAEATRRFEDAESALAAQKAALEALPEPPDPGPIGERLAALDATNAAVRAKQDRARLRADRDESANRSVALTEELKAIDKTKEDAISAAKMPLEGLSFDADGVLYDGVPFSQASSAEQLRVGIAMAMALNPTIRVIRITDGSLLDTENLALIAEMAGDNDFQVWVERVDETGEVGITIEDGEVV
jgi:DNA repair exonuclease SbcCD ATPase subunit